MIKTWEYRLYPTASQFKVFENTLKVCHLLYNFCIIQKRSHYNLIGKNLSKTLLEKIIALQKVHLPAFDYPYSQVVQEVVDRVEKAYENFFRGLKKKEKVGFPKLRKLSEYRSFTYKQNNSFAILERETSKKYKNLRLGKIGLVKMEHHRDIPVSWENVKQCRIVKKYNKYFVQFVIEIPEEKPLCKENIELGCDPGLENTLTFSNGRHLNPFKKHPNLVKAEEKVIKVQQELSENYEEIKELKKKVQTKSIKDKLSILFEKRKLIRKRLVKAWYKVYNIKKDCIFKKVLALARKCKTLYLEDTNIKELMSKKKNPHKNIRSGFQESSLSRIKQAILNIFKFHQQEVVLIDSYYTSQICSNCGKLVYKELEDRIHKCPYCKYEDDRDVNSAKAILKIGKGLLKILPEEIVKFNKHKNLIKEYC